MSLPGITPGHSRGPLAALLWDYDGTLIDTRAKNLSVTRAIVAELAGGRPHDFPALASLESYSSAILRSVNWRDFYAREFGFTEAETDVAGGLWTEFQLRDTTPTPIFPGLPEVLHRLGDLPQGIVSQSSREAIRRVLDGHGLLRHFASIIGFEEVELRRQKPEPDGLLRCIAELAGSRGGIVLYVGDHATDAACARNADATLRAAGSGLRVRSIGARYAPHQERSAWTPRPDFEAWSVQDILAIVDAVQ